MRHLPSAGVGLLTINADIVDVLLVVIDEFGTLYKHTTRTTAGVVDTAFVGLEYLHNSANYAAGSIEFTGILTFHRSELLQAVFVDAT